MFMPLYLAILLATVVALVLLVVAYGDYKDEKEAGIARPRSFGFVTYLASQIKLRFSGKGSTWLRTGWWIAFALLGALAIAYWIGGTQYVQSWAGTLLRGITGSVLGFLVSRFLLRINVSDVASRYADLQAQARAAGAASLSQAIVVAAAILAICTGI